MTHARERHYFVIEETAGRVKARIIPDKPNLMAEYVAAESEVRVSPIFPVDSGGHCPRTDSGHLYVYIVYSKDAYLTVSHIQREYGRQLSKYTWYTLGLANPIIVVPTTLDDEVISSLQLLAYEVEVWAVDVETSEVSLEGLLPQPDTPSGDVDTVTLETNEINSLIDFSQLPQDYIETLRELSVLSVHACERARRFWPEYLSSLNRLNDSINAIIYTVGYIVGVHDDAEETVLNERECGLIRSDDRERTALMNEYMSELIQLSSSYSYFVSQAFSGTGPLLHHRAVAHHHSVFGLGTAIKALERIYTDITFIYNKWAIDELLAHPDWLKEADVSDDDEEGKETSVVYTASAIDNANFSRKDLRIQIARALKKSTSKPREVEPKLPYFSGRFGYAESRRSISCAIQALYGAATCRWSLLTLTHELLHDEVNRIWKSLFGPTNEESGEERVRIAYKLWQEESPDATYNVLEVMQVCIIEYCLRVLAIEEELGSCPRTATAPQ